MPLDWNVAASISRVSLGLTLFLHLLGLTWCQRFVRSSDQVLSSLNHVHIKGVALALVRKVFWDVPFLPRVPVKNGSADGSWCNAFCAPDLLDWSSIFPAFVGAYRLNRCMHSSHLSVEQRDPIIWYVGISARLLLARSWRIFSCSACRGADKGATPSRIVGLFSVSIGVFFVPLKNFFPIFCASSGRLDADDGLGGTDSTSVFRDDGRWAQHVVHHWQMHCCSESRVQSLLFLFIPPPPAWHSHCSEPSSKKKRVERQKTNKIQYNPLKPIKKRPALTNALKSDGGVTSSITDRFSLAFFVLLLVGICSTDPTPIAGLGSSGFDYFRLSVAKRSWTKGAHRRIEETPGSASRFTAEKWTANEWMKWAEPDADALQQVR